MTRWWRRNSAPIRSWVPRAGWSGAWAMGRGLPRGAAGGKGSGGDEVEHGKIGPVACHIAGQQPQPRHLGMRPDEEVRQHAGPGAAAATIGLEDLAGTEQGSVRYRQDRDLRLRQRLL